MAAYAVLTALLFQKGSAESGRPPQQQQSNVPRVLQPGRRGPCSAADGFSKAMRIPWRLRSCCCSWHLSSCTRIRAHATTTCNRPSMAGPSSPCGDSWVRHNSGFNRSRTGRASSSDSHQSSYLRFFFASADRHSPSVSTHRIPKLEQTKNHPSSVRSRRPRFKPSSGRWEFQSVVRAPGHLTSSRARLRALIAISKICTEWKCIGFFSDMIWLPEHDVGAVVVTNGIPGFLITGNFQRKLLEVLLVARMKKPMAY